MLVQYTGSFNSGNPVVGEFGAATAAGNLLVCTIAVSIGNTSPVSPPTLSPPSTPGFTWVLAATYNFSFGTYASETVAVYYIANAASMATSVQTTCAASFGTGTYGLGMQLLEFLDDGSAVVDVTASAGGNAPSPATAGNLTTTGPGFILCFVTDPFFDTEFAAGAGYTLIPTGGVGSGYGDNQYQNTFGIGTYSTAFGSSISGGWCMVAIAFKLSGGVGPPPWTGGGAGFTPIYPPIHKQPRGSWGMEAKRADSITADGVKQSVLDRIDNVTTLKFENVALSDLVAFKAFEEYALTGGQFAYRPIPDYPNIPITDPMFQFPGSGTMDTGYSVVQILSMDWTPKFKSFGIFSLEMKLRLIKDL